MGLEFQKEKCPDTTRIKSGRNKHVRNTSCRFCVVHIRKLNAVNATIAATTEPLA